MINEIWHSITCDKRITLRLPCTCTPSDNPFKTRTTGKLRPIYQMMALYYDADGELVDEEPTLWMDVDKDTYDKLSVRTDMRSRIVYGVSSE